jgi:hypothetical protein
MPFEAYIGYLCNEAKETRAEVETGKPFVVEVRDLDTFERKVVQAIVAEPSGTLEGADELWVLDWIENRLDEPWSIRVLKELDEEEEAARADITEADRTAAAEESVKYGGRKYAGSELPDAMGQEEARKYYEHVTGKGRSK